MARAVVAALLLLLLLTLLLNLMLSIRISELNLIIMIVFLAVCMLKHSNFPTSHTLIHTYVHTFIQLADVPKQIFSAYVIGSFTEKSKTKYKLRKVDKSAGHNYVHTFV